MKAFSLSFRVILNFFGFLFKIDFFLGIIYEEMSAYVDIDRISFHIFKLKSEFTIKLNWYFVSDFNE